MEKKRSSYLRQSSGSYISDHQSQQQQIWIDPFTNERIWVFNPMHIVQLTKQSKSRFIRVVEGFRKFSNKWFSHILMLLFLVLYGFLGAYIFVTLEAPIESSTKTSVNNMRQRVIKELWWSSQKFSKGWWQRLAKIRFKEFEKQLYQSCLVDQTTDSERKVWDFWQALFFSSTIFTTIGYGHVVPKTDAGRMASIIYAFIGIPLLLMVLTDLGKLFTRGIKFVFKYCRKLYYLRHLRKMRRATKVPSKLMTETFDAMGRKMSMKPPTKADKSNKEDLNNNKNLDETFEDETIPDFEVDDEFNLPISVAVTLLLIYMMCGAAVFTVWEKWTFFESFYFVYISLSTIGFGDYVPEDPMFMMCTFIYLLFGLALTSMCINVVQEKLSATFQSAKLRLGATMGLDVTQILEEEMFQDNAVNLTNPANISPILKEEDVGDSFKERRQKRQQKDTVDRTFKESEPLKNDSTDKSKKNVDFKEDD